MEVLWAAEKLMVKAEVEALVMLALVEFKVVMVPVVDQRFVAVRLVELALVMVPVVENKVGAVRMEVEALTKLVWPLTVSAPPR